MSGVVTHIATGRATLTILDAIRDGSTLTHAENVALRALADRVDGDGRCHPSVATMAAAMRVSPRKIRAGLHGLSQRGIVTTIARARDDKTQTTNTYEVHLDRLSDIRPPCLNRQGTLSKSTGGPCLNRQGDPSATAPHEGEHFKGTSEEIPPNPPTGGTLGEASQTAEPDPWGLSGVDSEPADHDGRTMAIAGPKPTTALTMATDAHAPATIVGTDHRPGVSADDGADGGPQAIPSRLLGPASADQLPDETAPQSAVTAPRSDFRGSGAADHGQGPSRPPKGHKRPGTTVDLFASPAPPKPIREPSARAKARASRLALAAAYAAAYAAGIRDATGEPYAPPTAKWELEALDGIVDTYAVDAIGLTIADPTELAKWLRETAAAYRRAVEADDTHRSGGYAPKQCIRWLRGGGLARTRPALATAGPWHDAIAAQKAATAADKLRLEQLYARNQTERNLTHA